MIQQYTKSEIRARVDDEDTVLGLSVAKYSDAKARVTLERKIITRSGLRPTSLNRDRRYLIHNFPNSFKISAFVLDYNVGKAVGKLLDRATRFWRNRFLVLLLYTGASRRASLMCALSTGKMHISLERVALLQGECLPRED